MDNSFPDNPPPLPDAPPLVPVGQAASPLTAVQMQAVTLAQRRAKKIRSAAWVAMFNGIWLWVFSGISLLIVAFEGLFSDFDAVGLIMGVGMGMIAWNEFHGRKLLLHCQLRAAGVLGWNQVALMVLIVGYASWMLYLAMHTPNSFEETMQAVPQSRQMLGSLSKMVDMLKVLIYGVLIVGSVIGQGCNALYYFTRAKFLRAYLSETPAWVIELQRRQAGG